MNNKAKNIKIPHIICDDVVSVIVPVYNSKKYIKRCVQSIISQTYKHLEILLINDGSSDFSGKICDKLAKTDSRIIVIHQKNQGISAAQNVGLDKMTGKYVAFCDNDDFMKPEQIETLVDMIKYLELNNTDNQSNNNYIATCRWHNVGNNAANAMFCDYFQNKNQNMHAVSNSEISNIQHDCLVFKNPLEKYENYYSVFSRKFQKNGDYYYFSEANWSKLYCAKLFENVRFPDGMFAQDIDVNLQIYQKKPIIISTLEKLYVWVQHSSSSTHQFSLKQSVDFINIQLKYINQIPQNDSKLIMPYRTYTLLLLEFNRLKRMIYTDTEHRIKINQLTNIKDSISQEIKKLKKQIGIKSYFLCCLYYYNRRFENLIYNFTLHKQK